jgi:tetratricopeptide (TPR) repeat protein
MLAALGLLVGPAANSSAGWAPRVHSSQASQNSLKAGIDAYKEGALEVSVEALSSALQGNLSKKQRAQALYFRGLAYRELGLPGQAILDLTGAISLRRGLSKAHLKNAVRNRAGAYREAGLAPAQLVVDDDAVNGSRTTVPVPAGRVPVPDEPPHASAPLTTGSISTGQPPPAPPTDFVKAVEKLIPDWP